MEGTEDLRKLFMEHSQQTDLHFLVQAMRHVNEADVQYRGSNHQRLLVELTLMQICSLQGVDKKKNSLITIQANAWRASRPDQDLVQKQAVSENQASAEAIRKTPATTVEPEKEIIAPPASVVQPVAASSGPEVGILKRRKVSLIKPKSLQSFESEIPDVKKEFKPVLRDSFDLESLNKAWSHFAQLQAESEKHNISSTLLACALGLESETIEVKLLNKVQEQQVKEIRVELFEYLREHLKNDFIAFNLVVQESEALEISSQFLSERERYDAFVEKNPHLDTLRKRLDLDLG
jgi:DNA polymerase-3 subunit gamma/tau